MTKLSLREAGALGRGDDNGDFGDADEVRENHVKPAQDFWAYSQN